MEEGTKNFIWAFGAFLLLFGFIYWLMWYTAPTIVTVDMGNFTEIQNKCKAACDDLMWSDETPIDIPVSCYNGECTCRC